MIWSSPFKIVLDEQMNVFERWASYHFKAYKFRNWRAFEFFKVLTIFLNKLCKSAKKVIISWAEAFSCVSDYFNGDENVQSASLLCPVIFSVVPFISIFIQLEERKYTKDGSGIILLINFVTFCAFLPSFLTGTHKFSQLSGRITKYFPTFGTQFWYILMFWRKFRFLEENFDLLKKISIFWPKFRFFNQNFDFWPKFRFLTKIWIFD